MIDVMKLVDEEMVLEESLEVFFFFFFCQYIFYKDGQIANRS